VIQACLKNSIKKLIFVSSCLTIMVRTDGKIPCEEDWSEANLLHHYPKSKYLAEKAFWEQAEKNGDKLEFISALPSLVLGPAFTKHGNSS
jgi:nucleoside-diphosphate-sugar epimerase